VLDRESPKLLDQARAQLPKDLERQLQFRLKGYLGSLCERQLRRLIELIPVTGPGDEHPRVASDGYFVQKWKTPLNCFVRWRMWNAQSVRRIQRHIVVAVMALMSASVSVLGPAPASAVPAPEVEYTYNVIVRRHFDFPNNDALGYGLQLCDKVTRGVPYADVMADTKRNVFPNDEQSTNYVVSYAVGILCPAQTWQLRNSAAAYRPRA
jgi:hypothetical protein